MIAPHHAYAGMWDFSGACAPREDGTGHRRLYQPTFTLGCFQWVSCNRSTALKKGRVQFRVKGVTADPAPAYAEAREYCTRKNAEIAR